MATHTRMARMPHLASQSVDARPRTLDGKMGAAVIATGVGSVALGIASYAAIANEGLHAFLARSAGAGVWSGETLVAGLTFLLSWIVLHVAFRGRRISAVTAGGLALLLILVGLALALAPVIRG